jgi:uncharacterized membrane-anchored protein
MLRRLHELVGFSAEHHLLSVIYALLLRSLWSYPNATNVAPILFQRKPASHALSPGIVAAAAAANCNFKP